MTAGRPVAPLPQAIGIHHRRTANGLRIHYVEAGEGPPVLLLHGWPFTWYSFRHQIPALVAAGYRVIAPDLRGYGATEKPTTGYDKRTMARDALELLRGLGIQRAAVIGHDRGARVATRFAKDHPDAIDRLTVIDNIPTRHVFERMDARLAAKYWIFSFNAVPELPEALITGREETWLRWIYRDWSYDPGFLTDAEIAVYVQAFAQPGGLRGGFLDYRAGGEDFAQDQADADRPITVPTQVLWGRDFELVGGLFDVLEVWRGFARDVRGAAIPLAGHMPHEEQPELVNRELLGFLDGWRG